MRDAIAYTECFKERPCIRNPFNPPRTMMDRLLNFLIVAAVLIRSKGPVPSEQPEDMLPISPQRPRRP